ncbi:MAG: SCO family protein [Candidatus Velthaea sp.]
MKFRFAIVACAILVALGAAGANASQILHGIVLTVLTGKQQAIVRHEAYGGMPAMAMLFTLSARDAARLRQGDQITADVKEGAAGEALSNVRVLANTAAVRPPDALRSMTLLKTGDPVPTIPLIDQNGRALRLADFRGKTVVLSFVYTRCRDTRMCPLISAHFHQLQQRLDGSAYHLVEVTLDPEFDRPPVLAEYAKRFDADASRWTIATGDPRSVLNFAAQFGIVPFPDPKVGLIHSERTALVGRDGRIADFLDEAGWDPNNVIARLQMMNAVPANPIALMDYVLSKGIVAVCGNEVAGTSGLLNLILFVVIFGSGAFLLFRIGRFLYTTKT